MEGKQSRRQGQTHPLQKSYPNSMNYVNFVFYDVYKYLPGCLGSSILREDSKHVYKINVCN